MTRPFTSIALILAALGWWVFNWPVLQSLHRRWWTVGETYEIGYPLLLIALYWIFAQRAALRATPIRPSVFGAILFLSALLLSGAGRVAQVLIVQQLMVPVSLWCAAFALAGPAMALRLLVPCGLLLAGVPVWDFLVEPLRALTVWAVQGLLGVVDIPALVQGYQVILSHGVMIIADACSGLNLLLAAAVIGLLQASLNLHGAMRKALLVAASLAIGIVDNWLRVFGLILIAHYSQMRHPLVHDHASFGWWLFAASLVPLFYLAHILQRGERPQPMPAAAPSADRRARGCWSFGAAAVVLALGSGALLLLMERLQARAGEPVQAFAAPAGALPGSGGWLPHYEGYELAQRWRVVDGSAIYDIVALSYPGYGAPGAAANRKLIYYANRIADPQVVRSSGAVRIDGAVVLNETVIREGIGGDRIVWWLYRIDDSSSTSAVTTKLLQLRSELIGDRQAALLAISRLCGSGECQAERAGAAQEAAARRLLQLLPQRRET